VAEGQRDWSKIAENFVLLGVKAAGVVLPVGEAIDLARALRGTGPGDEVFVQRLLDGIEQWCRARDDAVCAATSRCQ
jgi:hypothetical protein